MRRYVEYSISVYMKVSTSDEIHFDPFLWGTGAPVACAKRIQFESLWDRVPVIVDRLN